MSHEKSPYAFQYQMLSRLKSDCDYFLGHGHRATKYLWGGSVTEHIAQMRQRWNALPTNAKPEWLTEQDIATYEAYMTAPKSTIPTVPKPWQNI